MDNFSKELSWGFFFLTNFPSFLQTRKNAHIAMAIPMMGYVLAFIFPVYVNLFKRDTMDLHRGTDVNASANNGDSTLEKGDQPAIELVETKKTKS